MKWESFWMLHSSGLFLFLHNTTYLVHYIIFSVPFFTFSFPLFIIAPAFTQTFTLLTTNKRNFPLLFLCVSGNIKKDTCWQSRQHMYDLNFHWHFHREICQKKCIHLPQSHWNFFLGDLNVYSLGPAFVVSAITGFPVRPEQYGKPRKKTTNLKFFKKTRKHDRSSKMFWNFFQCSSAFLKLTMREKALSELLKWITLGNLLKG